MKLKGQKGSFQWHKPTLGIMTISSGLTQFIGFGSTLALGHVYLPSDFGQYSLAISMATVLAPVLTFSMEIFIVPAKDDREARLYVRRIFMAMLRNFVILLFCGLLLQHIKIAEVAQSIDITIAGLLGLLLALLYATFSVVTQILLREQEFKKLAIRNPVQNFLIGASQIALSAPITKNFGLILGEFLGRIVGTSFLARRATRIYRKWDSLETKDVPKPVKPSLIFVNFSSIVFDLLSVSAVIFFSTAFFTKGEVGQVAMAQRILSFPVVLLGTVFSQYLLAKGAAEFRVGRRLNSEGFNSILTLLFIISFVILGVLYLLLPLIVEMLLGNKWLESITIIHYLIPATLISFIWNPLSSLFYVYRKWYAFLYVSMIRFLFILIAASFSRFQELPLSRSLMIITLFGAIAQLGGIWYLRKLCTNSLID